MMTNDADVWSKYLAAPIAPIKEVWYDVHIGQGIIVSKTADAVTRRVALGVGQKRIDCVVRVGGGWWVVEVKPRANMEALGQVISYTRLFLSEFRPDGEVWPVIVCDEADPDLLAGYDQLGVVVIEV